MPESQFPGLICRYNKDFTFCILPEGGEFVATVEPEFRPNGTQSLDGLLPRRYKTLRGAKAALGRLLGSGLVWVEIERPS